MGAASCGFKQMLSENRITPSHGSRPLRRHQVPITARLMASAEGFERTTTTSLLASSHAMRSALAIGARSRERSHASRAERISPKVLAIIHRMEAARQGIRANGRVAAKAL